MLFFTPLYMTYPNFRKLAKKIHLWLGLITGAIVFVICITGSIYAFQKEIKQFIYPYYSVENTNKEKLPLKKILEFYETQSENKILQIREFTEPNRSIILRTTKDSTLFYSFINPYTGELLKEKNQSKDFFAIVLRIHRNLLLKKEIGRKIIGCSVIIFVISLLTGIILWFPKNRKIKKIWKSKLTIKKTKNKKRVLYDLHNVLGFYSASFLLIIAITGLAWTFSWVDEALYRIVTFEKKTPHSPPVITNAFLNYQSLDSAKQTINFKKNRHLTIYALPEKPTLPLKVSRYPNDDSYGSSDYFYFHPETGKLLKTELDINKKNGTKLRSLYYDIHTGSILGFWGKIIVFFTAIIGASLPITGVLFWIKKNKKASKT